MVSVGKYKLMGGAVGAAGGCYGAYELYNNCFGGTSPSSAQAANTSVAPVQEAQAIIEPMSAKPDEVEEVKEVVQEVKEEIREEVPQAEPKPPVAVQQEVSKPAVEPKAEEDLEDDDLEEDEDDMVEEPAAPVVAAQPKANPSGNPQTNGKGTGSFTYSFHGKDGTMKMWHGTLGTRFQKYLLTTTDLEEVWKKKVEDWEKDLEQYEKLTEQQKRQYDALPGNFVVDRTKDKYKNQMEKALQQRCFTIYKHESWTLKSIHHSTAIRKYWEMAWKYCSKPDQQMPDEWRAQVTPRQ